MAKAELGTISHATVREADLIPAFIAELARLEDKTETQICEENGIDPECLVLDDDAAYWPTEAAAYDLEALFDLLDCHAPVGCYFGAHCGDGSDFGFWPIEEFLSNPEDFGIAKVNELPCCGDSMRYRHGEDMGGCLVVTDHGNGSLFLWVVDELFGGGEWQEEWSIV